ncbi:MAG: DUF2933 domain-containing protein [Firmicutes bacterium]|nr:DUF2933 domain-containing protein [Bacillota bacterium]
MASKGRHGISHWLMLACCLVMVGAVFLAGGLGGKGGWSWMLVLLCPLAHLFMMRGGHQHGGTDCHETEQKADGNNPG